MVSGQGHGDLYICQGHLCVPSGEHLTSVCALAPWGSNSYLLLSYEPGLIGERHLEQGLAKTWHSAYLGFLFVLPGDGSEQYSEKS